MWAGPGLHDYPVDLRTQTNVYGTGYVRMRKTRRKLYARIRGYFYSVTDGQKQPVIESSRPRNAGTYGSIVQRERQRERERERESSTSFQTDRRATESACRPDLRRFILLCRLASSTTLQEKRIRENPTSASRRAAGAERSRIARPARRRAP